LTTGDNSFKIVNQYLFRRIAPREVDRDGREVTSNRGYKYFGAAKDLPGVRELFQKATETTTKKTRAELMRNVDADYYGYMDDDDGLLIPLEKAEEKLAIVRINAVCFYIFSISLLPKIYWASF
jgi:pre-mRNA-splicing factor ISY1